MKLAIPNAKKYYSDFDYYFVSLQDLEKKIDTWVKEAGENVTYEFVQVGLGSTTPYRVYTKRYIHKIND